MSITSFSRCFCEDVASCSECFADVMPQWQPRDRARKPSNAEVQCSLKFFFIMDCQALE